MKWSLRKEHEFEPLPLVELTEDERHEFDGILRTVTQGQGAGVLKLDKEHVDSFQRSILAKCLIGRAKRFVGLSLSHPSSAEDACRAAERACAVCPLSIYFYDFACTLKQVGKVGEAKTVFREFLRRYETESLDPVGEATLRARDLAGAARHAREQTRE